MTRLAGRYGGDYAVADVARVMRMPGLQNQKPARESWGVPGGATGVGRSFRMTSAGFRRSNGGGSRGGRRSGKRLRNGKWVWYTPL